ncbi:MAG: hypothetical protein JWO44_2106 [Bacteroidetes bacterium]|nr:hypothetical protein [Bacteroidota bacterium]
MKKLILAVALFAAVNSTATAQDKKSSAVSICKSEKTSFSIEELEKCNMLITRDEKIKVKSFKVSILVKGNDGKDVFIDYSVTGNVFSGEVLETLKAKKGKISKVIIEDVIAVDVNKNEQKLSSLELSIK